MMIHPSAFVHPQAQVHPSATVGPWCLVDAGAVIGADVILESRVHVYGGVQVGEATHIYDGAVVGSDPQDLKYNGEPTRLHIGAHCRIREYCTLNRGTGEKGCTVVGDSVLLMAYTHVAHDCLIGQGAVLANGVQLGGHVRIGAYATIGGNTAVHQFSRVGDYAFVGGTLKIDRDVPPASKALGNPLKWAGLNLHALRKHGFSAERIAGLEAAYRKLYRSGFAMEAVAADLLGGDEALLCDFFRDWKGLLVRP
jgi:UDP-N-acetylglucosamine acyltransferase